MELEGRNIWHVNVESRAFSVSRSICLSEHNAIALPGARRTLFIPIAFIVLGMWTGVQALKRPFNATHATYKSGAKAAVLRAYQTPTDRDAANLYAVRVRLAYSCAA